MARKQRTVVEIQCDRCTRTEEREEPEVQKGAAFVGEMSGVVGFRFDDLCGPCYRTVKNHFDQIGKKLEGASPDRVVKGTNEGIAVMDANVSPVTPADSIEITLRQPLGGIVSADTSSKILVK